MTETAKEISAGVEHQEAPRVPTISAGVSLAIAMASMAYAAFEPGHLAKENENRPSFPENLKEKNEAAS